MKAMLLVAVGGAFGSMLRHGVNVAFLRVVGPGFPFNTAFVNVTGSFVMGLAVELIARRFGASADLRLLLMTGLLGGYTTFSAFSLDAVGLYERGASLAAIAYIVGSVVLSLAALFAGLAVARHLA